MTGSDFYAYILRTLKRTDKETEVYEAITDAVNEIESLFAFPEKQTTSDVSIVATNYRVSLPSGFGRLTAKPTLIESGVDGWPLEKMSISEFNELESYPDKTGVSTSTPEKYSIYGTYIYLYPVADKSYTLRLYHSTQETSSITSVTAIVPFSTDKYRRLLKAMTLYFVYIDLGNANEAGTWAATAKAELDRLTSQDTHNQSSTTFTAYID